MTPALTARAWCRVPGRRNRSRSRRRTTQPTPPMTIPSAARCTLVAAIAETRPLIDPAEHGPTRLPRPRPTSPGAPAGACQSEEHGAARGCQGQVDFLRSAGRALGGRGRGRSRGQTGFGCHATSLARWHCASASPQSHRMAIMARRRRDRPQRAPLLPAHWVAAFYRGRQQDHRPGSCLCGICRAGPAVQGLGYAGSCWRVSSPDSAAGQLGLAGVRRDQQSNLGRPPCRA